MGWALVAFFGLTRCDCPLLSNWADSIQPSMLIAVNIICCLTSATSAFCGDLPRRCAGTAKQGNICVDVSDHFGSHDVPARTQLSRGVPINRFAGGWDHLQSRRVKHRHGVSRRGAPPARELKSVIGTLGDARAVIAREHKPASPVRPLGLRAVMITMQTGRTHRFGTSSRRRSGSPTCRRSMPGLL